MGEQADYELDRMMDYDYWLATACAPRKGRAAPELVPADPQAFDDLTSPVLEAVAPRQMELLEWPGV